MTTGDGIVFKLKSKINNKEKIMRMIAKKKIPSEDKEKLREDIINNKYEELCHSGIVKVENSWIDNDHIFFITENHPGKPLLEFILEVGDKYDEKKVRKILKQVLSAMIYL